MKRLSYHEQGSVLLIALIIVAAVSILSGSILYMLKTSMIQNQAIENYNNARNTAFLSLKRTFQTENYIYTNTPFLSSFVSHYAAGHANASVTRTIDANLNRAIFPDSAALNNASAILQYYVDIDVAAQNKHQVKYEAIVNAPSQYRQNNNLAPEQKQNVNIPVVILTNLIPEQRTPGNLISDGQAGFLGSLSIDNEDGKQLIYMPDTGGSHSLKFQDNGHYQLEQGWYLSNGAWHWSLMIYDLSTGFIFYTEISLSELKAHPEHFSNLVWTRIILHDKTNDYPEYDSNRQYSPGSYVSYHGQSFLAMNSVNSGTNKDPYSNWSDWRLIISAGTYPQWNSEIQYYQGDMVSYNGTKYVATMNDGVGKGVPPSNGWAVKQLDSTPWQNKAYPPGSVVTYMGYTFVNVHQSNDNKTPFQENDRWRIIPENDHALDYNEHIYYTEGLSINYDNQIFVNIIGTENSPYQDQQLRWKLQIPELQAPNYNTNVRYYQGDMVTDPSSGLVYRANVDYNNSIKPENAPPNHGWLQVTSPILSIKWINIYDKVYGFILMRESGDIIKGWFFDKEGTQMNPFDFGIFANVTHAYVLPIDVESNQHVTKLLLFLSTSMGLTRIIDVTLSDLPSITDSSSVFTKSNPSQQLGFTPQFIYSDVDTYFLILPYQSSIDIYTYDWSTLPAISLNRTVSFTDETLRQVIPFRGFVIVITQSSNNSQNAVADFIALAVDREFATVNLTTTEGVYISYDQKTQRVFLKTETDQQGVEIQNAPMPYGVIGMQSRIENTDE